MVASRLKEGWERLDQKILFDLGDLDIICVKMAFVNMSLLGMSA